MLWHFTILLGRQDNKMGGMKPMENINHIFCLFNSEKKI